MIGNLNSFGEVQKFLADDPFVKRAILKTFGARSVDALKAISGGHSPEVSGIHVEDFLFDLLHNEARLYKRFTARGDEWNFHIDIRGFGGVYFYGAPEYDDVGYFLSIEDAESSIIMNWNDNLVSEKGRTYRVPFQR